jgi:CRP/FNR family transcriptional regulator
MSPRRVVARAKDPDLLRRLGFFRELTLPELRRLARLGSLSSYDSGEFLATEGTRKQRRILYVIVQGKLQYVKRVRGERASVMLTLLPGEVGGFLTFFNDDPSPVSVRSVGKSRVFEIGRREFQVLMADRPSLAAKVLLALLRATVSRLEAFLGQAAATSAWALDLQHHLQELPLAKEA